MIIILIPINCNSVSMLILYIISSVLSTFKLKCFSLVIFYSFKKQSITKCNKLYTNIKFKSQRKQKNGIKNAYQAGKYYNINHNFRIHIPLFINSTCLSQYLPLINTNYLVIKNPYLEAIRMIKL